MSVEEIGLIKFHATEYIPRMSCINCGSPFHEKWDCTKRQVARGNSKPVIVPGLGGGDSNKSTGELRLPTVSRVHSEQNGLGQAIEGPAPVDIIGKRRGRPQTITDIKAYKAAKAKEYRARKKPD